MAGMRTVQRTAFLIVCIFACLWQTSCDDYNIVEPRFYEGDDVASLPNCEVTEIDESPLLLGIVPHTFAAGACWVETPEIGKVIIVRFDLPIQAEVNIGLFNSAGILVTAIAKGTYEGGTHYDYIENADTLERGVYAISFSANDFKDAIWFEID